MRIQVHEASKRRCRVGTPLQGMVRCRGARAGEATARLARAGQATISEASCCAMPEARPHYPGQLYKIQVSKKKIVLHSMLVIVDRVRYNGYLRMVKKQSRVVGREGGRVVNLV